MLGRVKTPSARREELLDELERSGLSGRKFAELAGVNYQTFPGWAQKRRRLRGSYKAVKAPVNAAEQVRCLQAVVEEAQAGKNESPLALALELELPGGARLEIRDSSPQALAPLTDLA